MLSTNPLDYLPQIDQRGLIAKRNLETHAAGFGNNGFDRRPPQFARQTVAAAGGLRLNMRLALFWMLSSLQGIAPESIIALSLSPTKIKSWD
jgi:hypothetical protein